MERFQEMLPEVWREVSRHIEIGESADTIFQLLRAAVPAERMAVYRLDPDQRRIVAAAAVPAVPEHPLRSGELSERQLRKLLNWIRKGEVGRVTRDGDDWFPSALVPDDAAAPREWFVAPLSAPHGTLGLFVLIPTRGTKLLLKHEALIRLLQEPLGVALENDRRLHELQMLREAAEADRRSLLTRLGRKELADPVIGSDSGLHHVLLRVRQIARSEVPVLILGETGTGKELIAREIHHSSERSHGPFIRVNCGAIPSELIDSQLFGHEKGSFTGAVESRQGWFERASGGTLFLDEIGELPLDAQVRFLRVLQDGFVERVGGSQPIHVDVRVVAATHRDLANMVVGGQFREDLWYRLAVFPILLPPLRERKEDIPALVEHFLDKAATRFGLVRVHASDADIRLLQDYDWPGNIRELGAVIDRAALLGEGRALDVAVALGATPAARKPSAAGIAPRSPASPIGNAGGELVSLDDAIRSHIRAALEATGGRVEGRQGAASILRINPHTLRAKMRKLKIDWATYRSGRGDTLLPD
ncbi:MAG: sigma-54-dependent Fis family transcriptional regulator [Planctomycetaceae bacterium]|nr:sigma-54-dependent Fis family transcriptional regulator [Planctomycetaceae bacterium]